MFDINMMVFFYFLSFFFIAICFVFMLLKSFGLNKSFFFLCAFFSTIGHFIGGFFHAYISTYSPSDTAMYFTNAAPGWHGFGVGFIENIIWYLRSWFFGNSFFGAYSFFAFIGSISSALYLICMHKLILLIDKEYAFSYSQKKLKYGYLLVACLPSAFFWTSILGKDTISYFCVALFFLSLIMISRSKIALVSLVFSIVLGFMIRPYLALVGVIGYLFWVLFAKKKRENVFMQILLVTMVILLFVLVAETISSFGGFEYSYDSIVNKAVGSQVALSTGSHIPVPTTNPYLLVWFLPYTVFCNLFLPLFFWINNFFGVLASFQNVLLIILFYKFKKRSAIWGKIKKIPVIGYMFWYFIVGMCFMGILNTNLGLADREKLMYLPPFLIIMCLTIAIKKTVGYKN